MVDVRREDIDAAAERGILTREQADRLWDELQHGFPHPPALEPPRHPRLRSAVALAGALLAAGPTAWTLLLANARFGGAGQLAVSAAAAAAFVATALVLDRRAFVAAGGVLFGAAAVLAGLAVHGLQHAIGIGHAGPREDLVDWMTSYEPVPLAVTAGACLLAMGRSRFPGLAAVLVGVVWFGAMSAAPAIFGPSPDWSQRALLSALVGVVALGTAFMLDRRTRRDFAFWLYLAGLVALWGGLTTYHVATELSVVAYLFVNGWLLAAGLLVRRRILAIFGAVGFAGGAGHFAQEGLVPAAVPFAIGAIALGLVAGALLYLRIEEQAGRALARRIPPLLRRLLPPGIAR